MKQKMRIVATSSSSTFESKANELLNAGYKMTHVISRGGSNYVWGFFELDDTDV